MVAIQRYDDSDPNNQDLKNEFTLLNSVTGEIGITERGLARTIGVHHSKLQRLRERVAGAKTGIFDLPERLQPFAGKDLRLAHFDGKFYYSDKVAFIIIAIFATDPEEKTEKAEDFLFAYGSSGIRAVGQKLLGWVAPTAIKTLTRVEMARQLLEAEELLEVEQAKVAILTPKAEFADDYLLTDGLCKFEDFGKNQQVPWKKLMAFLRDEKVLYKRGKTDYASKKYEQCFRTIPRKTFEQETADGYIVNVQASTCYITPEGVQWLTEYCKTHKQAIANTKVNRKRLT